MPDQTNPLIAALVADLDPVTPMRQQRGRALVMLAMGLTIAVVALVPGLWNGIIDGRAAPIFFIANGLIALVGLAAAQTVVRMAAPRVGARQDGLHWLLAALAILPGTALLLTARTATSDGLPHSIDGVHCFLAGTASGVGIAIALIVWLRRGAPVAPKLAGLYTGIAAGALGSFAYGLSCPYDTIGHLGIWHIAPIVVAAALGRVAIPRAVRW